MQTHSSSARPAVTLLPRLHPTLTPISTAWPTVTISPLPTRPAAGHNRNRLGARAARSEGSSNSGGRNAPPSTTPRISIAGLMHVLCSKYRQNCYECGRRSFIEPRPSCRPNVRPPTSPRDHLVDTVIRSGRAWCVGDGSRIPATSCMFPWARTEGFLPHAAPRGFDQPEDVRGVDE